MPKKLVDCVKKVSKRKPKSQAWAICVKSTGLKPHKKSPKSKAPKKRKRK